MKIRARTINSNTRLTVRRLLPVKGEILVRRGQIVTPLDVVARAEISHRFQVINVSRKLGRAQVEMDQVMLKAEGDTVKANEAIAVEKGRLPFLQRPVRAPAAGRIATVGPGWVLLETDRKVIEVQAFIHGIVSNIIPDRGVILEGNGAMIQAACGFGGEAFGRLRTLVSSPFQSVEADAIGETAAQSIILAGRTVDEAVIRRAEAVQVRGIIVGSIDAKLLRLSRPAKVRVVATEGFGNIPMSPYTFGVFTALNGREISLRGQTAARASAPMRETEIDQPLILGTVSLGSTTTLQQLAPLPAQDDIGVGSRMRVARGPLLGAIGQINSIPQEPLATDIGIKTSGAHLTIDGASHYLPWSNLEQVI